MGYNVIVCVEQCVMQEHGEEEAGKGKVYDYVNDYVNSDTLVFHSHLTSCVGGRSALSGT